MHTLALCLGGRTVSELERDMTEREYLSWVSFYNNTPFGPDRDNWHAGMIAAMIRNTHIQKGAKPASAKDFMWTTPGDRRTQQTTEFIAGMKRLAVRKNGKENAS